MVYYLHGDHLGSASLAADASGAKVSEMRYTPFGETRFGDAPTDRRFTGQRREAGLGLYDYGARYYDPALGRFLQADTMVPSPANPQSLNRYAYTLNNPLRYTDPTGHFSKEQIEDYLRKHYGGQWKMYWDAWESDHLFFSMLAAADFGDVLFAPTSGMLWWEPDLPSGIFSQDGDIFGFSSEFGLEAYQGKGPYILEDKKVLSLIKSYR